MRTALTRLDALLGRGTMYRLVTVVLAVLAAIAVVLAALEELDPGIFTVGPMLLSLVVLVASTAATSVVLGLGLRTRVHVESSVITALILWFLYWPAQDAAGYGWLALLGLLAGASKFVLAWRGRHVFNPAAAAAVLLLLLGEVTGWAVPSTSWWAASEPLFWPVLVGALLILHRTRRLPMGAVFVVVAAALSIWGLMAFSPFSDAWQFALYSSPIVFFAGVMLSEPLTLSPRRWQQLVLAAAAAVLFTWPLWTQRAFDEAVMLGPFENTYEIALLAVNLAAFLLGQRGGVRLDVVDKRRLTPDVWELRFHPQRPLRFRPGQYLELDLTGRGSDRRGTRRAFSISSAPGDEVTVAVRVPERPSAFKQALVALDEGDVVRATSVSGDFTWPRASRPMLLVAGGIGITPFVSQLRHHDCDDVVLVYGVTGPDDVAYRDELAATGARVVVVSPERPDLPAGWTWAQGSFVTREVLDEHVPDHEDRVAYVSGPPAMVHAVRRFVPRAHTDYFSGY
ncbi:FAD-dependent oxidoreductase [Aeromicrobium sp. IC_218]|uniref:ferredoxin--NADP reductase n=1 Tax=Aeromicrobium sp. IC_218 TaxID=2545468 RepID=UPI00103B850E|nr:FAD-dependent oxidoreductase [Aeromicrobium sp. IC_218]TCI99501.1 FAD-dependent oxidoreductase [Aeromicrobium sp. IC_218]